MESLLFLTCMLGMLLFSSKAISSWRMCFYYPCAVVGWCFRKATMGFHSLTKWELQYSNCSRKRWLCKLPCFCTLWTNRAACSVWYIWCSWPVHNMECHTRNRNTTDFTSITAWPIPNPVCGPCIGLCKQFLGCPAVLSRQTCFNATRRCAVASVQNPILISPKVWKDIFTVWQAEFWGSALLLVSMKLMALNMASLFDIAACLYDFFVFSWCKVLA